MNRDDTYYAAMLARDNRFDGKFFVGVRTTGIYCRPICPARPKRENIEFFPSHLAAERAGYRPCLRCRPESAPRSPAWIGKSAIVRRAIKALHDRETIELDEESFAGRFGVSARHLRRLFNEEIGKSPKQLSFENRLNLARKLLVESALPVTQVAFAAGFRSIRRFNEAFKERFSKSPSQLRRKPGTTRERAGSAVTLSLPYRPPFDFEGLLAFYRNHRKGELERFEPGRMIRLVSLGGKTGQVSITDDPARSFLRVEIDFPDPAMIHPILTRVRAMFDLDSDPVVVGNALERDPAIRAILKKHPGLRLPSGWDGFEVAVSTILGQLVSVERGRALVADLIEIAGQGDPVRYFPTPEQLARADLSRLKTTSARKRTLREFARRVASGELSLEVTQDVDEFVEKARQVPGIGPWTASYMCLKVLRHADAFPATDLILARALELHPKSVIEGMSPWRGYLASLFWREYHQVLKKPKSLKKKEMKKRSGT
jgi:AraC family transcriptional regulator of adaptative response / DNA-3-methyladenine glycosylase II